MAQEDAEVSRARDAWPIALQAAKQAGEDKERDEQVIMKGAVDMEREGEWQGCYFILSVPSGLQLFDTEEMGKHEALRAHRAGEQPQEAALHLPLETMAGAASSMLR